MTARTVVEAAGAGKPTDFSKCVERTRRALAARLGDAPEGDFLRQFFTRGKMLRALLVFSASTAVGGDPEDVGEAAEAIELLHGASLLHDDIIDGASERRGLESLHERLGVDRALVLGDELILRAFAVLSEARTRHPAGRVMSATDALNELARECCRGQLDELAAERWISEDEYLSIIGRKTAAPFVAASTLGALLAGADGAQVEKLRAYGRRLGIAFQIGDDLLDLIGERRYLGKPVGNSLARGRPMLPLIYLWRLSSDLEREELRRLSEGSRSRDRLVELVERHGIPERVRRTQESHVEAAIAAVAGLEPDGVEALRWLATRATRATLPAPLPGS